DSSRRITLASSGLSVFAPEAFSLKMLPQPAACSSAIWPARSWSRVDTRAYPKVAISLSSFESDFRINKASENSGQEKKARAFCGKTRWCGPGPFCVHITRSNQGHDLLSRDTNSVRIRVMNNPAPGHREAIQWELLTAVGVMIGMKNTDSEIPFLIVPCHNSPCAIATLSCHSLKSLLVRPS